MYDKFFSVATKKFFKIRESILIVKLFYDQTNTLLKKIWQAKTVPSVCRETFKTFSKLRFSQKLLYWFSKKHTNESTPTSMCACVVLRLSLPYSSFWKSKRGEFLKFWPIFLKVYIFSKTTLPNVRFWIEWTEQIVANSTELAATPIFFTKNKLWPSKKVKFSIFDRFFSNLLFFLKKMPSQTKISLFLMRKDSEKLSC